MRRRYRIQTRGIGPIAFDIIQMQAYGVATVLPSITLMACAREITAAIDLIHSGLDLPPLPKVKV